jgi:hypothetical protein
MTLSAALMVTKVLSYPKKRVSALATYLPKIGYVFTITIGYLHEDISVDFSFVAGFFGFNSVVF